MLPVSTSPELMPPFILLKSFYLGPAIVRHEAAVNTSPELRPLSDAAVDTLDLELPSRGTDTEVPTNIRTFVESAVSPPPEVIQQTAVQFTSHQSLGGKAQISFSPKTPLTTPKYRQLLNPRQSLSSCKL